MPDKINDEFSDLSVTRQRKFALRHPDKIKEYRKTDAYKKTQREYKRRVLGVKNPYKK